MQTTINTDVFIRNVLNTLMTQMDLWGELQRQKEVETALYMHLMNKTIIAETDDLSLPAEYVDDTPRVIEMFLQCLRLEKRTDGTIKSYRGELVCLFRFLNKSYADVTTNDIRAYLAWKQAEKHNNDKTLNTKIHVFQSFFKWVMNEDLIEDGGCLVRKPKKNPMLKVHKIKEEQKVKTVLTDEQVEIIRCDCTNVRDRAIVEILVATGMRVSELVGLNVDDIDINRRQCIIYGKGRKERPAFFTPRAIVHIQEYLNWRKSHPNSSGALIVNVRSTDGEYKRMGACGIRYMLKQIVKEDERLRNLNLHPHMFRAYLATYMARHGASPKDIARVLGHSNINTTYECYIIDDPAETQTIHGRCAA